MNVERENDLLKLKVERLEKDIANIRKKLDSTLDQLDKATTSDTSLYKCPGYCSLCDC